MTARQILARVLMILIPALAAAQTPTLTREYIYLNGRVIAVENAGASWPGDCG